SRTLPGFRFRAQQLAMSEAVARAIETRSELIAEAGTGTGKTFAYLVPALLYGGKVIVSTGTKTLQDQLYERDIPMLRDALRVPVTIAVLKGRANYVCHHHLERASREDRLPSRDDVRHLRKIIAFAQASERGDRAELAELARDAEMSARTTARDVPGLPDAASVLVPAIRKLRLAAGDIAGKFTQDAIVGRPGFTDALDALGAALDRLTAEMQHYAERSEDLASIARRADEAAARVARWRPHSLDEPRDKND